MLATDVVEPQPASSSTDPLDLFLKPPIFQRGNERHSACLFVRRGIVRKYIYKSKRGPAGYYQICLGKSRGSPSSEIRVGLHVLVRELIWGPVKLQRGPPSHSPSNSSSSASSSAAVPSAIAAVPLASAAAGPSSGGGGPSAIAAGPPSGGGGRSARLAARQQRAPQDTSAAADEGPPLFPREEANEVMHICGNPECLNSLHLIKGLKSDNRADNRARYLDRAGASLYIDSLNRRPSYPVLYMGSVPGLFPARASDDNKHHYFSPLRSILFGSPEVV